MRTLGETGSYRLRDIAVAAYGPTVVSSIGYGAVIPVLALRARDLGADVQLAALVVGLMGVGQLLTSLPAGALVARIGERRMLLLCGAVDVLAMTVAALTRSVPVLAGAVLVSGAAWTGFLLARQGFIIEAVPPGHRARALSALGASARLGLLVGPLVGAGLIAWRGLGAVFLLGAAMSAAAALVALAMPDLGVESRHQQAAAGHASVWSVLLGHRRTLLTLGVAVVVIGASRSMRSTLLPLWADHIHLSPEATSLLFAAAGAVDIAFFLPGGWLLDHRGRAVVAIPVVLTVALGALVMPLATTAPALVAVALLVAAGNGLGSGIVMTLGADTAPAVGRSQFLGGWRLCGDLGGTSGPLAVSALAAVLTLPAACVVLGLVGLAGTGWVGYWTRRLDRDRAATGVPEAAGAR